MARVSITPTLAELVAAEGESYSGLSRLLRRPPAYLGDRARRGTLHRLPADELDTLRRYFGRPFAEAIESSSAQHRAM